VLTTSKTEDERFDQSTEGTQVSVVRAVFSTTMFWKVSNESADLQHQIVFLRQPNSKILPVQIDIMRSASNTVMAQETTLSSAMEQRR